MPGYGAAMTPRKLPAGIQTFREVREGGFYYVDKTAFAQRLVEDGKHYFLSRPRRFGKSLFLDTLKELFEASEPLFRGRAGHAGDHLYRLGHPNREVRGALNASLLGELAPSVSAQSECSRLRQLLTDHDFAGVERLLRAFFASVPHQWFIRNDIARHEGFYASVFYAHFAGAGLDVIAEESTSHGRADMTVLHDGGVCVFEFKTGGDAEAALAQIKRRGYADKHQHSGQPIHLVGVAFTRASATSPPSPWSGCSDRKVRLAAVARSS